VPEQSDPHQDLAGVLHDVSNALTVLLGWVGEARAPGATAEDVAYALTIIEQRARIARDLARHAIGSPRIDEQRDVAGIVAELAQALRVEAARTGVKLAIHGAEGASGRVAGALDLSQVLTNLVLNALAHAPSGSTVEIAVTLEDDRCTVVVTDEGPGIEPARRESIFEGDSLRPGGTGVGLRHSRALARSWRGDVELLAPAPEPSRKGARFAVTWPRTDAVPRPPVSTARVGAVDLAGLRVLVVEDDAAVTQLLEAALDARGANVTVAMTNEAFAAAVAGGRYDAALVDLSPIAGDAAGALASLRASSPGARVVLITGQADALPEAVLAERVELVRKPFELREVIAALAKAPR
jgi:CheY-like chemotaxis protein